MWDKVWDKATTILLHLSSVTWMQIRQCMEEINLINNHNLVMVATVKIHSSSSTTHHHKTLVGAISRSKSSNTTICNTPSHNPKCNLRSSMEEAISLKIIQLSGREFNQATILAQRLRKARSSFITHQVVVQTFNYFDMYKSGCRVIELV